MNATLTRLGAALLALVGCAGEEPSTSTTDATDVTPCVYPEAPDVMAVGEPLPAFSWPSSNHADGRSGPLDLANVPCNDGEIDWSPFDVLLFVSIPAW